MRLVAFTNKRGKDVAVDADRVLVVRTDVPAAVEGAVEIVLTHRESVFVADAYSTVLRKLNEANV